MTDSTSQHIATRNDADLTARLIAVAEQQNIPNPEQFVRTNVGRLVSIGIDGGTTVTAVYSYAAAVRAAAVAALPPEPGLNPAAVTDTQLTQAIQAVWAPFEQV